MGRRRCYYHGGAPGSGRGNGKNGLYTRHLQVGQREAFDAALATDQLSRMDRTIALASAQLDSYLERYGLVVEGGQVVSSSSSEHGSSETREQHATVVLRHLDQLRRLEKTRAEIAAAQSGGGAGGEDLMGHDAWLAASRSAPPGDSGSEPGSSGSP